MLAFASSTIGTPGIFIRNLSLRSNSNADKDNTVVVMKKAEYDQNVLDFLEVKSVATSYRVQ